MTELDNNGEVPDYETEQEQSQTMERKYQQLAKGQR